MQPDFSDSMLITIVALAAAALALMCCVMVLMEPWLLIIPFGFFGFAGLVHLVRLLAHHSGNKRA